MTTRKNHNRKWSHQTSTRNIQNQQSSKRNNENDMLQSLYKKSTNRPDLQISQPHNEQTHGVRIRTTSDRKESLLWHYNVCIQILNTSIKQDYTYLCLLHVFYIFSACFLHIYAHFCIFQGIQLTQTHKIIKHELCSLPKFF